MNKFQITEQQLAEAVNSRSSKPMYQYLSKAHVGIAGLGGLGSNVAAALARCGVGSLTLADFDTVELSNINRQLYTLAHIGMPKTQALKELLLQINPYCKIYTKQIKITEENCCDIFKNCPIICEAFDIPESKAALVNTILSRQPDKRIVAGSGMAGWGRANEIRTQRLSDRFYICGDGHTDVADGEGLTAARVMICAGHQASKIIEWILQDHIQEEK